MTNEKKKHENSKEEMDLLMYLIDREEDESCASLVDCEMVKEEFHRIICQ